MAKRSKLIDGVMAGKAISIKEATVILTELGFDLSIESSHHVFKKKGYPKNISLKHRRELLPYQVKMIKEALKYYENS